MTHPFQWGLFVGPAWKPASHASFYNWFPFDADTPDMLDIEDTLTATLADGATSMNVSNAGLFASQGTAWVGPNGSGQAWELVEYTGEAGNTLTGLVREPVADREHNGVHSSGAKVRPWWNVLGVDGKLRCSMALDDLLVASEWSVDVSGIAAPQAAFRPYHIAVISYRLGVTGNLLNFAVGFLDTSTIRDDARRVGEWSARMMSVAGMLKTIQSEGVRVGEFDAVRSGSIQSPVVLAAAHKERSSGDFTEAAPNFDPQSLADEKGGIWISDRMVGTAEPPDGYTGITQVYINPPSTINRGTRWLEIINLNTASLVLIAYNRNTGSTYTASIPSMDATGNKRIIVCEDEVRFLAENPSYEADFLYNLRETEYNPFFNNVQAEGGGLGFMFFSEYRHIIFWGDKDESNTGWSSTHWTGPGMPAPGSDQTMRYLFNANGNANSKDDWAVGKAQSPGYMIESSGEKVWLFAELPGIGLILHEDITATTPGVGATLKIDGQNGPSTDGLPASGTLVVGDERISYSAKVAGGVTVSARGADSTTAAAHVKGDAIAVVFSQGGRTSITDAVPLKALKWERWGGTIYPKDFTWRYSALDGRTPSDDDDFDDDYEISNFHSGNSAANHSMTLSNNRAKSILLQFHKMTTEPARARLNRLTAVVDPAYYDGSHWLSAGETVEQLIERVAELCGMPSNVVTVTAGGAAPGGFTTAIDKGWEVMRSAAEMGASFVQVKRDSKIAIAPDTFWLQPIGGYTPVKTWTRSNATSVELIRTGGGLVSQVKLHWQTPDNSDSGEAVWPSTPASTGVPLELGPFFFANEAAAQLAARKRYAMQRYPYVIGVTLAAGDISVEPHQVHRLTGWQLATGMQDLDRLLLVTQVDHQVEKQTLTTVLYGLQIDRESDG